ncbi:hypothetical protein D3C72_583960 [compost metagenome]
MRMGTQMTVRRFRSTTDWAWLNWVSESASNTQTTSPVVSTFSAIDLENCQSIGLRRSTLTRLTFERIWPFSKNSKKPRSAAVISTIRSTACSRTLSRSVTWLTAIENLISCSMRRLDASSSATRSSEPKPEDLSASNSATMVARRPASAAWAAAAPAISLVSHSPRSAGVASSPSTGWATGTMAEPGAPAGAPTSSRCN